MKKHYAISGMHCRSCEILVEQHLVKIPGVRSARVNHTDGTAEVSFDDATTPNDMVVAQAIRAAGYKFGSTSRLTWLSTDPNAWTEAAFALAITFVLFLGANLLGLTSLTAQVGTQTGAWISLIIGLTAGVSTCAALVGGLVLGVSARYTERHPSATPMQRFRPHLFFGLGRIVGFIFLGAVIGSVGAALQPSATLIGFFMLLVGAVMISLGLQLTGLFPRVSALLTLPKGIARVLGVTENHEYSHWRAALTGALTFFLPCGFTQAMQLAAVTSGSPLQGALIMGAFAVGTAPGLMGIAGISSIVKGETARFFFKVAGIIVIGLGLWNISNGWSLTGIVLGSPSGQQRVEGPRAELRDGKQYFRMEQWAAGYNPNAFTVQKGIPFVWQINSTDPYTCASSLVVPSLGIRKNLVTGENIVEFTPTKTGPVKFSCSMGMFDGIITVVD